MKIVTEETELQKPSEFSTEYIETSLRTKGIDPLRWAVVKISSDKITVSVSYRQNG